MNATRRGAIVFGIILLFTVICSAISFGVLPSTGSGVALPVIAVPGEPYREGWPSADFSWTNTLTAMVLTDVLVIIFLVLAWRSSDGWKRRVPGRFQGWVEMLGGFIYGQTKNFAGTRPLARNWLFPLAASIFVFLLAMNWMKLLPGIESVGVMHCAGHENPAFTVNSGYPKIGDRLWVDSALNSGYDADEDDYHACHEYLDGHVAAPSEAQRIQAAAALRAEETALEPELAELTDAQRETRLNEVRLHAAESIWSHATVPLDADDLERGVEPYKFVVTPYVRGGSTDLNLTLGLSLIAFFAFQIFGVAAQGPSYFLKFINLTALGNLQKKPLGAVDFVVGLFEIVSEIGKIISLAFRLFGNMFAGGILLAVMSFLVSLIIPSIFVGLEVIVTTIQAFVFAVLTIVFSAQAMEGHHSDDHDEDHHHDVAGDGHAAEPVKQDLPIDRTAVS
jgi:F-type H+-transporting ATPase subunit a